MKHIKYINKYFLLVLVFNMCFGTLSHAQTAEKDSTASPQNEIRNIAFGKQPAWMVTGAISTVKGSELNNSFTSNLSNTFYGKLPGLTVVQNSCEPGVDSPSLYIRGLGTFGSGNSLLVIVDGFESNFEQLVPEEVESVTLLKDASATAMYGSRGANGVLLITTRRGKHNTPLKVNLTVQEGFESAQRLPDFLGSYDYANFYNKACANDGKVARYTAADLDAYLTGNDPVLHPDIDWYDKVLRKTAPVSKYNLSFSGGKNKTQYFVLLNVLSRAGLLEKTGDLTDFSSDSKFSQYNIRTNVDIDLTERLMVSFDLGVSIADKANPVDYTTSKLFNLISSVPPNAFPVIAPNGEYAANELYTNPWGDMLETGFYTWNYRTVQTKLKFVEQLDRVTKGLSLSGAVAFNNIYRGNSGKSRSYKRYKILDNGNGGYSYLPFGDNTSLSAHETVSDQWRNIGVQAALNYGRIFGTQKIEAILGYNLDTYELSGDNLPFKHVGVNGRFTYGLQDKYIGEFSFAYEGSENFPRGERFGFFPAVSAGWIASNEEFMKENNFFDYLKFKVGFGMVGNDNIGGRRFMFDQAYVSTSPYYYGTTNVPLSGYKEGPIANPDVTWEKQKQFNVGFEANVAKNWHLGFDYFNQDRSDILTVPNNVLPLFLGMEYPSLNIGKVNNRGFEATVGYASDKSNKWQVFADLSVWYAKNKIIYNAEAAQKDKYLNRTGRSIGQPYLLEAIGFFKDQVEISSSPKQVFDNVQPGDIKYRDQNNDNIIDQNDYSPIGKSAIPEITLGLHTGLKYMNFDLDIVFQGVANRSVYLSGKEFYAFQNNGKISSMALGAWTSETASTATYPRLSSENNLNNFQPSSFWQRDGSFVKLRSVELGYNLEGKLLEKLRLSKSRIFINGTNLFSLDHMDKLTDPEVITGYPAVRTLSLGAKIQF